MSKPFSRDGFRQLHNSSPPRMTNSNDATIDIPLTTVTTNTGVRPIIHTESSAYGHQPSVSDPSQNEKAALYGKGVAGRRRVKGNIREGQDGEEEILTQMGKIYEKILNFSVVTRYFLYVLPLALMIAVPMIVGATAAQKANIGGVRLVWFFLWIEIVWLSLWVSKLAAKTIPWIFQFLCGIVSSGTRKYVVVLQALEIPLSLAGWALTCLATFVPLMTRNPNRKFEKNTTVQPWENIVQKILAAALITSLIYLGEKLIIQLISIGYHRKQFNAKIQTSKRHVYLLSLLYDASRRLFPAYCREFVEEDYLINRSLHLSLAKTPSGHVRSGSATPLRFVQNVGRFGDKLTAAFGNIAQEVTGRQVFNPEAPHSIVVEALEKNRSSEALAKRLWMSFVVEGKDALYEEDIREVLGAGREAEADECFACLDRDNNGDVSLDEMILTVCEFSRDRRSIVSSLHDVDQAINVLDGLLCTVVFILSVLTFVAFLNSSFTTTLATAGTALLSMSFVFATTTQEVLGSCIFLFVKHPYDVGDRVDINNMQLTVEHISLLFTVFKQVADHKMTQVPNIVLNTVWVDNVSRSSAMRERLLINISFDTTLEDIQLLRNEMEAFVRDKDNCRDFQPDIDVEVTGLNAMDKMELKVEIRHKSNWANETVRAARRSKFMCALVLALRKIPICAPGGGGATLGSSDSPSYSVAVSDAEAAAKREAFAKTKEAKRLVPSPAVLPPDPSTSADSTSANIPNNRSTSIRNRNAPPSTNPTPATEKATLDTLHTRAPSTDPARDNEPLTRNPTNHTHPSRSSSSFDNPNPDTDPDLEAVRASLLLRHSTLGKRRSPRPANLNIPTIAETSSPPPRIDMSFRDFVASAQSPTRSPVQMEELAVPMEGALGASGYAHPDRNPQYQNAVQALQGGPGTQPPPRIPPLDVRRG